MRILIAEDDAALAGFIRQGLQGEHYTVDVVEDGEQARAMGSEFDYDLVILDLNLPKLDGVSVLRHLRLKRPSLPVLVLTQRSRVEDRVQCLDTGADDYLPKPFSFNELSARIRALLRRSRLPSGSVLVVEDLKLDRVEHRAERAGRRIDLTSKEFSLLEYLMRNAGRQVSRAMIIEHVWNLTFDTTTNVVDVYINLNLAVPVSVSHALLRKISAAWNERRPRRRSEWRERLKQRLLECPFPVELAAGDLRAAVSELSELAPPQVLNLGRKASEPASLLVAGVELFRANPARCGDARAAHLLAASAETISTSSQTREGKKA